MTWRSSKQDTIAASTTKSEYISTNEAVKVKIWLKKFINDLGVVPSIYEPFEIFHDNKGAVDLAK